MRQRTIPHFQGTPKKNDALFMYGAAQAKPFVFVYKPEGVEVVYGPSCRVNDEIIIDNCIIDDVPFMSRRTGGGTVVLSPGTIVTLVVGERAGTQPATYYFDMIHDAMIRLLTDAGISGIAKTGISDCAIGGRKILGSSLYLGTTPRFYYYQSSILVAPDLSLFDRYLRHPPREPSYRNKRSHAEFCTSLEREGATLHIDTIRSLFSQQLPHFLRQRSTYYSMAE
jgi:lipoate---protein ligase